MSSASLAKPGILDVVRNMLNMFILVLCTESLCTSGFGVCPSAFPLGKDLQHLSHPSFQLPGGLLLQPASWMASPLRHIAACPAGPASAKATPQNLWSSWVQVLGPSPLGKLSLATSACFHACVVPPLPQGAHSRRYKPRALGPQQ